MKPTISNAFNDGSSSESSNVKPPTTGGLERRMSGFPEDTNSNKSARPNPRKSLAASLSAMQVDLRETNFGWSLDLSPIQAVDALNAVKFNNDAAPAISYLVSMEQSAWRDGDRNLSIAEIAQKLAIPVICKVREDELVMSEMALRQLVSLCQPSRLVVIAVDGEIDERDAGAMDKAIDGGKSPLLAELRAVMAMEVLGDRSVVMHCREQAQAHALVAENFRHYLAALCNAPADRFEAPELWQIERLLSLTGMMTIRPIETQQFSTSIDVGINTGKERFSRPADRSLIYDIPSNTWHDEP